MAGARRRRRGWQEQDDVGDGRRGALWEEDFRSRTKLAVGDQEGRCRITKVFMTTSVRGEGGRETVAGGKGGVEKAQLFQYGKLWCVCETHTPRVAGQRAHKLCLYDGSE